MASTSDKNLPEPAATSAAAIELDPVAQTLALLQPWISYVPRQQRRLGVFIFLAFLVHLAAFFAIRIDTTRGELPHQPRIHVTVDSPEVTTVEGRSADDFWDRLTDPRLFLLPQNPTASLNPGRPGPGLVGLDSSLSSGELPSPTSPQDYRLSQPAATPIEQRAEEAMRPSRQPFAYDETPPRLATRTTWQWDADLAQRQPGNVPDLPSPVSDTDLNPTELRVAVDSSGTVQHVMVEQSCGSGRLDLDQQAILAARKIRFRPTDQAGLQWGIVTVFWNYAAKPREEVVPTPPSTP